MVYTFGVVDVKEYIASGILETVALGLASDQEQREVQCLQKIYPEIREELIAVEAAIERMALEEAIAPAPEQKAVIMAAIRNESQIRPEGVAGVNNQNEAKIVSLNPDKASNPWKWVAAACMILVAGSAALWMTANNRSGELESQLAELKTQRSKDAQVMLALQVEQQRANGIQQVLTESSTRDVMMAGTAMEPTAAVKVMWSEEGKKAVMMAKSIAPPPSDMQYQLWAIADGKPVSLGVFDYDEVMNITEPFDVVVDKISAFAITLEKRGGVESPTMEKMVVLGTV